MWVDKVNNERNIHLFIDEEFLLENIPIADTTELNWMKIFNSKVKLSKCFIIKYIDCILWEWLMRPLDESIIFRYQLRVKQWNVQLYGETRTYEFINHFKDKFDWKMMSMCPPSWFSDVHFDMFGHMMDWTYVTNHIHKMSIVTVNKYKKKINWSWVTRHHIRDEVFAYKFKKYIEWDDPHLHVLNLSTEFLYEIYEIRQIAYDLAQGKKYSPANDNLMCLANNFHKERSKRIGSTITFDFWIKHKESYDWVELDNKGLLTQEMMNNIQIL